MELAPWRSPLARALHRNRSKAYSRYPQLATVRSSGRPANRTVVFRDFLAETNSLTFVSDARSKKMEQIVQNASAELCWYFTQTREQFRIGGEIFVVETETADHNLNDLYHGTWESLSDNAQQQFDWPCPGQPRVSQGFEHTTFDQSIPPKTFAVLVLVPDCVDHLELRGEPQNRYRYEYQPDGTWKTQEVNP